MLFQVFPAGYIKVFKNIKFLVISCMFLCNDKYYSAPRLGKLLELMFIKESVSGIPGMIHSQMPLALSARWGAGTRSRLGSVILVGILLLPRSIPMLCSLGAVCKMENL